MTLSEVDLRQLRDEAIRLRPWLPTDADAVYRACQDPLIPRFVPVPQPYTLEDAAWFVAHAAAETEAGRELYLAITDASSGELLGAIGRHVPVGNRVSFGYWLAAEARGRGVATRALRLITAWTLAATDLIRLELCTHVDNHRSGAVAERAGFIREGVRYAWDLDREGQPMDAMFYVRIRGR